MTKKSEMKLEANVYSQEGKEVSQITLSEKVFGVAWNADLVHDVVVSMQGNARSNTAHTKNRSEVRGGGKKPWQQKGTGRARHGSSRSPIWAGGGVAHGPRNERDFTRKINKNVRAKALASVLSQKLAHGEIVFIDALTFSTPKTAEARKFLTAIAHIEGKKDVGTKKTNAALVILSDRDEQAELSFRNMGNVHVMNMKDVNPVELLTYKYVVVAKPEESLKTLETRVVTKTARKAMAVSK
ncbi:MAG: 50S ribosomal protein L4 [Candidatus Pacebacteria bacterium]|nr:50S ribosomal protein L4 [Candidatus Paceibacterota bacterium]MCF7857429.1 50S ribosomal protein L4 [Candidatus Paceibacterota bacterium]